MNNFENLFDKLQITTNIFHNGQYCGNWQVDTSGSGFINFHAITHGHCYLHCSDGHTVYLEQGDIVLLPTDGSHFLSPNKTDSKKTSTVKSIAVGENLSAEDPVLLCGYFEYQHPLMRIITQELPKYWVIKKTSIESRVLHESIQLLINASLEPSTTEFKSSVVLNKIAEIVFLLVIKHLMGGHSSTMSAMLNPALATSLLALHDAPQTQWSVDMLAKLANMSKSNYANQFKKLTGITPIKYLTQWRLRCAGLDLKNSQYPIITIANKYGYDTESSFSKAFKREMGVSPSIHRNA